MLKMKCCILGIWAKVDKITVVSTGSNGSADGTGVDRVTTDMAAMIAQVPAILETLTGVKIADLLTQVPQIAQATNGAANGHHEDEESSTDPEAVPAVRSPKKAAGDAPVETTAS